MATQVTFRRGMSDLDPVTIDVNLGDQVEVVANRLKTALNNNIQSEMVVLTRMRTRYGTIVVSYLDKSKCFGDYVDDHHEFMYEVLRCDCQDKAIGEPLRVFVKEHRRGRMLVLPAYRKMTIRQWKQFVIDNAYRNVYGDSQVNYTFWAVHGALDNNRKTINTTLADYEVIVFADKLVNEADGGGSPIFTANRYVPTVDAFQINTQIVLADYIHAVESDDEESDEDTSSATAVPSTADVASITDIASATDGARSEPDDDDDGEGLIPVTVLDKIKKSDGIALNQKDDEHHKTIEVKVPLMKGTAKLYYNYGASTTIGEMKQSIVDKFNMEIHQFTIYLQSSPLEHYDTIDSYVTPAVTCLDLVPKIRGGGIRRVIKPHLKEGDAKAKFITKSIESLKSYLEECETKSIITPPEVSPLVQAMMNKMAEIKRKALEGEDVLTDGLLSLSDEQLQSLSQIFDVKKKGQYTEQKLIKAAYIIIPEMEQVSEFIGHMIKHKNAVIQDFLQTYANAFTQTRAGELTYDNDKFARAVADVIKIRRGYAMGASSTNPSNEGQVGNASNCSCM